MKLNFILINKNCFDNKIYFRLVFNTTTNKTSDMPGVIFRVPEFGNTTSLEWLDPSKTSAGLYFSTIVEQLVAWGYRRGKDIRGAPVDWRRAPSTNNYF
jgi:lysophospholipase-3